MNEFVSIWYFKYDEHNIDKNYTLFKTGKLIAILSDLCSERSSQSSTMNTMKIREPLSLNVLSSLKTI